MASPHGNPGIAAQSGLIGKAGFELGGCLGSSAVLEAGSPGCPLSSCSCQSLLKCSAIIGTQLFDSVIYPPINPTTTFVSNIYHLVSTYSRLFCSFFLFPSSFSSSSFFNGFCPLISSASSMAYTYSCLLSTWLVLFHGLCYHLSACLPASALLP